MLVTTHTQKNKSSRRPLIAVIGEAGAREGDPAYQTALELGEQLVDNCYRVCSGGLGGVMTAVFYGARQSAHYKEGDTVAIIPTLNNAHANPYADIVISTGLGHLRNGIVAAADAVMVVGGKAGTLSEMAMAWRYNRLIVALSTSGGIATQYAGKALDNRKHRNEHLALMTVADANTAQEAIDIINKNLSTCYLPTNDFSM